MRVSLPQLVLAAFLILCIVTAACTSDETPPPAPPPTSVPQRGVLIQTTGNITGQGILLPGVPRGTIDTITFSIGLVPGARPLDITNTTIVYSDAVRTENLLPVEGYRGDPPAGFWGIIDTVNGAGSQNLRLEFEKQFVIRINPKAPIVPNQVITISVKPEESRPLILRVVAPPAIVPEDNLLAGL